MSQTQVDSPSPDRVSSEFPKAFVDYRGYLYCPGHANPHAPRARVLPARPIYARNSAHDGEICDYPGCAYAVPAVAA